MRALEAVLETWVLAYLLNSLWQVPLVCVAAFAAARLARPAGPRIEHRVWVGALLLEAVLPLCHLRLSELWTQAWSLVLWFRQGAAAGGETRIIVGRAAGMGTAVPWLPAEMLAAIAVAYGFGLMYFAARLAWGVWKTESMRRQAARFTLTTEASQKLARCARLLAIDSGAVRIVSSSTIGGPAAVGLHRPTLLLPPGFLDRLEASEMDALFAHELAHMQRQDFAKNLLYGIISLPIAYHPLLSLTRARLAETRELVCDAMAAEAVGGRESYARSLLRLASMLSDRPAPRILHAIGILDANIFERRVMHLTRKSREIKSARRFAIAAACALIALVTCTSALALRMEIAEPDSQNPTPPKVHVKVTDLKIASKVQPVYPPQAKKDHVRGTVILSAIIGKDGVVENLKVTKSVRDDMDQSAIDAVRQWRYEPYLLNGDPIEVQTDVRIIYTLAK
jgi:TonB family protein